MDWLALEIRALAVLAQAVQAIQARPQVADRRRSRRGRRQSAWTGGATEELLPRRVVLAEAIVACRAFVAAVVDIRPFPGSWVGRV